MEKVFILKSYLLLKLNENDQNLCLLNPVMYLLMYHEKYLNNMVRLEKDFKLLLFKKNASLTVTNTIFLLSIEI